MKHPPLLQSIAIVAVLGFLHLAHKQGLLMIGPIQHLIAGVIVLVGAGLVVAPIIRPDSEVRQLDDDLDMSA